MLISGHWQGRLFTLSLAGLCAGSYLFSVTHTMCSGQMAEKYFASRQNIRENYLREQKI